MKHINLMVKNSYFFHYPLIHKVGEFFCHLYKIVFFFNSFLKYVFFGKVCKMMCIKICVYIILFKKEYIYKKNNTNCFKKFYVSIKFYV